MKTFRYILCLCLFVLVTFTTSAQEKTFFTHTVNKGQTLYSISKMYGISVDEIAKYNPGCMEKLPVGYKLRIPQKSTVNTLDNSENSDNSGAIYHTIKSGETLYRLSKMYGVTTQEICEANPGLSISNFRTGEVILIPKSNKSKDETSESSVKKEQEERRTIIHEVERNESIKDICKKYGVSEDELKESNPGINFKRLKKNTILRVPIKIKKVKKEKQQEVEISDREAFRQAEEYRDSIEAHNKRKSTDGTVKVAVILPFLLDNYAPSEQGRMVEYYQGLLMAVKELKEEGYSYEINTFDSGHKEESLDSLLTSGALNEMDIIIGALYTGHNKELAKFAKENNIPLVIPFTSKEDEIFRNPMVYIVNAMQSYIIPEVTSYFIETFPNANVIFVEDTEKSNKMGFVTALTEELDKNEMSHFTMPISNFYTGEEDSAEQLKTALLKVLDPDKENIFIPTSSSAKMLNTLIPTLIQTRILDESDSIPQYKLFGYPEWQIYAKETRDQLYDLDTYFYATFYSHYSMPESSKFQDEYIKLYSRNIQNIYPRYGMLGYDTGRFFLLAASKFGSDMPDRINEIEFNPIQTGFKFERVNNWGGMVNKKVYFIHYTRDYNIEKIDFIK